MVAPDRTRRPRHRPQRGEPAPAPADGEGAELPRRRASCRARAFLDVALDRARPPCEEGQRPAHRSRQAPALNTLRWSRRKTHGFANRVWGALTRFRVRGGHVVVESCARPDDLEELILGLVAAGRAAIRHCARATRRARAAGRRRRRRTTRPRATSEDGSAEATRPVGQPGSCSASRLTIDFVHPTGAYPGAT